MRRLSRLGWLMLLVIIVAAISVWYVDTRMKQGVFRVPQIPRLTAIIEVADAPGAWRLMLETMPAETARAYLARPLHEAALGIREATGIRPTPLRLSAWLGHRLHLMLHEEGWILIARPGLLMRVFGPFVTPKGVELSWRDGQAVFASSATVAKLHAEATWSAAVDGVESPQHVRAMWRPAPEAGWTFFALNPQDWHLRVAWAGMDAQIVALNEGNAEDMAIAISASSSTVIKEISDRLLRTRPANLVHAWFPGLPQIAKVWELHLWPVWEVIESRGGELNLYRINWEGQVPSPEVSLSVPRRDDEQVNPLLPLPETFETLPYVWNAQEGLLVPLAGPWFTVGTARHGESWMAAMPESRMYGLMHDEPPTRDEEGVLRVRVNWRRLGELGQTALREGTEAGWFWTDDAREVEGACGGWFAAMRELGRADIFFHMKDGVLFGEGPLFAGAERQK